MLLPGERAPLHIFEPRYRALLSDCVLDDVPFVLLQGQDEGSSPIGTTAHFIGLGRRFADGRMNVTVMGGQVVRVLEETPGRPYLSAWVEGIADDAPEGSDENVAQVHDLFERLVAEIAPSSPTPILREDIPLSYAVAGMIEMPAEPKQDLLECRDEDTRLQMVADILSAALAGADQERIAAARARTNGKVALP